MIQIEKIIIHEFRGIRDLTLEPKGQNFAACGPNGTGKSGIVDAIEFALTGSISRLSGRGTGGLSVKQHGPHVDFEKKPAEAWVKLEVSIPSLGGKKASIHRTVKNLKAPLIIPADPDILTALDDVQLHPEFVLSRRELIRYVISEPGDRAKEVLELLRLEKVEKLRVVLQKIANGYARELKPIEIAEKDATARLVAALGIPMLAKQPLLASVNTHRLVLGLPPLADLTTSTVLTDGLATASGEPSITKISKIQLSADIQTLKDSLSALSDSSFVLLCEMLAEEAEQLMADQASVDGLKRETLINQAMELYDNESCPVCDKAVAPEEFTAHLKEKLTHLKVATAKREALGEKLAPIMATIVTIGTSLAAVIAYGTQFKPQLDLKALADMKQVFLGRYQQLQKVLPLDDTVAVLKVATEHPSLESVFSTLEDALKSIPDPSGIDASRYYLVVAQERLITYREAKQKGLTAKSRSERAAEVFKVFNQTTTTALESVYAKVQDTFGLFYSEINKDDESGFTAKLIPSMGKLGFDVDFYGRGFYPPGAYHSEGHQDGMGLCLYLALMNHLLGNKFTFAVLDDVLMSVDKGHRREVCALLKEKFPNTQFIVTTHDEVWLRHMKSEGMIKNKNFTHFRTWSVDTGPKEWTSNTVWDEINASLAKNDVSGAAANLRRYLEFFAGEAADRLRGKIEYKGNHQFMLGALLPSALNAMSDCLKKAKSSAASWGNKTQADAAEEIETKFIAARAASQADEWQVNTAVHYNAWAELDKKDFIPVVSAFKTLTELYSCANCSEMLFVTPDHGEKNGYRCGCAQTNFNLLAKSSIKKVAA